MKYIKFLILLAVLALIPIFINNKLTKNPKGITGVDINYEKFTGQWFEIAMMENSVEQDLKDTTIQYSLRGQKGFTILTEGFDSAKGKWAKSKVELKHVEGKKSGRLNAKIVGPINRSHIIFDLDSTHYNWAYITSYNREYLWLIARENTVSEKRKRHFLEVAEKLGYKADNIIFVEHTEQGDRRRSRKGI